MRVLILQQAALPGQMLAPGVVVEVDETTAAWLIESGAARTADTSEASRPITPNPVLDGVVDVPPAPSRSRRKTE